MRRFLSISTKGSVIDDGSDAFASAQSEVKVALRTDMKIFGQLLVVNSLFTMPGQRCHKPSGMSLFFSPSPLTVRLSKIPILEVKRVFGGAKA